MDYVRVVKIPGQGVLSSSVLRGMIFRRQLNESKVDTVNGAKVAVYSGAVDWTQTETKGTVRCFAALR